jgi:putative transcriptional regulator
MESMQSPYLLLAMPQMDDPYFMKTVVLILKHTADGAKGLIINKTLRDEEQGPALMRAEIKDLEGNTISEFDENLFDGGPVGDDKIISLHNIHEIGDIEIKLTDTLFMSEDPQSFQRVFEFPDSANRRRFFLGHSEWTPGQLENELRSGAWYPTTLDSKILFGVPLADPEQGENWQEVLWKSALKLSGLDPLTLMSQGSSSDTN